MEIKSNIETATQIVITPTENEPVLEVGEVFYLGDKKCTVTDISDFSGEKHYGFLYHSLSAQGCSWISVNILHGMIREVYSRVITHNHQPA